MRKTLATLAALAAAALPAQDAASARSAYQAQQTLAEVPRLIQQFDQLLNNQDAIAERLGKVESGGANAAAMQAQIDSLRAEIAQLRADLQREKEAMRREIVADLSRRIAAMPAPQPAAAPAPKPAPRRSPAAAPQPAAPEYTQYYEHTVESGQTLSLIARGFGTTVKKILEANPGLKPNALQVGQKIIVPAEEEKKGSGK